MKGLKYIFVGIVFGVIMIKSEAASWYRIQEMFRFHSFRMYGIIGMAVVLGIIAVYIIKKTGIKDVYGNSIRFQDKDRKRLPRYIIGGLVFGLGWALAGTCPGPMFVNVGYGYSTMLIVISGALAGTYIYGIVQHRLP